MDTLASPSLEQRLERNEILSFVPCPFALPDEVERGFLYQQREGGLTHRSISLDPDSGELSGFARQPADQARRLGQIMKRFGESAQTWLSNLLPGYARSWHADLVCFKPEEEATRRLRPSDRNDLLHVDASPTRPTDGRRILKLFVNLHPTEPRVWVASDDFAQLLHRFGDKLNRTANQWTWKLRQGLLSLFQQSRRTSEYDDFMLRLQHLLKSHDDFQDRARKRFHHFAPGTAWLAFTDGFCYAELRGRYTLEHSFFVAPEQLALPELAPATLWQQSRQRSAQAA